MHLTLRLPSPCSDEELGQLRGGACNLYQFPTVKFEHEVGFT